MSGITLTREPETTTLIDNANSATTYIGTAKLGTASSAAGWQIIRISTSGTVTSVLYANGSKRFNQIWDDRASLTYQN